nr:uncharacterized protein LOC106682699 isoform X2 [Halyomorpha halys]
MDDHLDRMTSSLLEPMNNLNDEIKATVAEFGSKQVELQKQKLYLSNKLKTVPKICLTENLLSHANLHSQWDLQKCLDLTGDWKDGVLYGMKFAIDTINITTQVWTTVSTGMNCSDLSFMKVLPCYYKTVTSLKDQIFYVKEKMAPLLEEGKQILLNMKNDLKHCIGFSDTLQHRIEKNLDNCVKNYSRDALEDPPTNTS